MTFAPQKPYLRSLCCRNRRPATLSTPCPILPRKAPVEIPVQNGEKFAFSPICCRPPPSPPPSPPFPPSLRRAAAVRAAARRSESKGARRCSALLAGWLWLAWPLAPCRKMGSVPASVSGQRPTETERGAADCGRPPHAHTCTHTRADCGTDTPRPRPRRRTPTDTPNGQGTTTWALARRAATGRPKLEISGRRVRFLGVNKAADVSNNPGLDLIIYDSPYSIFRIEES